MIPKSARQIVVLSFAVIVGCAAAAHAQAGAPGAAPAAPAERMPDANPGKDVKPPPGIVHPGNPDPGIAVKPPKTGTMQVVPPPGTPGGNLTVIPK
jgi:hypothetical protein